MWLAYVLLLFTTFFWGATFIFVKVTVSIIPVNYFLFLRFGFATLFLFPYLTIKYIKMNNSFSEYIREFSPYIKKSILLGLFLFASFYFQTVGLQLTTPARAAFITGLNVVFVPVISVVYLKTILQYKEWLGVVLAIGGTSLLTLNFNSITNLNLGDLIIILTAISIAIHIILARDLPKEYLAEILTIQFLTMALIAYTLSRFEIYQDIKWYSNSIIIATLVLTVIFATVFAFGSQFYAQNLGVPPTHIGVIFATEPVFALFTDILSGVIPSIQAMLGMGLILSSIVLISLESNFDPKADKRVSEI